MLSLISHIIQFHELTYKSCIRQFDTFIAFLVYHNIELNIKILTNNMQVLQFINNMISYKQIIEDINLMQYLAKLHKQQLFAIFRTSNRV